MRFYCLSPYGVPENQVLFPNLRPYFNSLHHSFVNKIEDCDVVLMDLHTRIAEYNQLDINWMVDRNIPLVTFDEYDKGGMSDLDWPSPLTWQQQHVFNNYMIDARKQSVHFCRLLNKTKEYRSNLYPFEKPILYQEEPVSANDLFNRTFDICWIANSAPQRERLASALRLEAKLKVNIILGARKIPYNEWIDAHRQGKLFISCSAGGYSNECVQSLFSIAGHIKEKNDQLLAHPFTNGVNCISISDTPTKQELDYLRLVVGNKEELYKIYTGCYEHMKKYYSAEAIANGILEKIIKHCT